eukprot:tig00000282_g23854.t1
MLARYEYSGAGAGGAVREEGAVRPRAARWTKSLGRAPSGSLGRESWSAPAHSFFSTQASGAPPHKRTVLRRLRQCVREMFRALARLPALRSLCVDRSGLGEESATHLQELRGQRSPGPGKAAPSIGSAASLEAAPASDAAGLLATLKPRPALPPAAGAGAGAGAGSSLAAAAGAAAPRPSTTAAAASASPPAAASVPGSLPDSFSWQQPDQRRPSTSDGLAGSSLLPPGAVIAGIRRASTAASLPRTYSGTSLASTVLLNPPQTAPAGPPKRPSGLSALQALLDAIPVVFDAEELAREERRLRRRRRSSLAAAIYTAAAEARADAERVATPAALQQLQLQHSATAPGALGLAPGLAGAVAQLAARRMSRRMSLMKLAELAAQGAEVSAFLSSDGSPLWQAVGGSGGAGAWSEESSSGSSAEAAAANSAQEEDEAEEERMREARRRSRCLLLFDSVCSPGQEGRAAAAAAAKGPLKSGGVGARLFRKYMATAAGRVRVSTPLDPVHQAALDFANARAEARRLRQEAGMSASAGSLSFGDLPPPPGDLGVLRPPGGAHLRTIALTQQSRAFGTDGARPVRPRPPGRLPPSERVSAAAAAAPDCFHRVFMDVRPRARRPARPAPPRPAPPPRLPRPLLTAPPRPPRRRQRSTPVTDGPRRGARAPPRGAGGDRGGRRAGGAGEGRWSGRAAGAPSAIERGAGRHIAPALRAPRASLAGAPARRTAPPAPAPARASGNAPPRPRAELKGPSRGPPLPLPARARALPPALPSPLLRRRRLNAAPPPPSIELSPAARLEEAAAPQAGAAGGGRRSMASGGRRRRPRGGHRWLSGGAGAGLAGGPGSPASLEREEGGSAVPRRALEALLAREGRPAPPPYK